jgi:hypothetical protein
MDIFSEHLNSFKGSQRDEKEVSYLQKKQALSSGG